MKLLSISFSLLFTLISSSFGETTITTRGLRGHRARNKAQESKPDPSSSFICNVSEVHGINAPGHGHLPHRLACTTLATNEHYPEKVYNLLGSTRSFFEGEDIATGMVQIRATYRNVVDNLDIILDDTAIGRGDITITYDSGRRNERTKRKLNSGIFREGIVKILVVRVTDDARSWGVAQSEAQLVNDVFDDENNVETVYRKCSHSRLLIEKATGSDVNEGIVTVPAPENVCSMNWGQVSEAAMQELVPLDFDATHKMLVMPDCVDFQGAEAWGLRPGTITWFPSRNIATPIAQVHELGHNFGHDHSGKGDSPYGDDTGYMGNQALWTDEGSVMCFNAPKMWHFGWYSPFHRNVYPTNIPYKGQLAGLHDVRMGYVESGMADFILRAKEGDDEIYIMFNRMEGANRGVRGSPDMVTITRQHGPAAPSMWLGALGSGQSYTYPDWAGSGKNLIIKNCGMTFAEMASRADIIMYVEGLTHATCDGSLGTGDCMDIQGWHDADGPAYNCGWYANDSNCLTHGDNFANEGHTANSACCQCGGGIRGPSDEYASPPLRVTDSPTKSPTNAPTASPTKVSVSGECVDEPGWYDADGPAFNCAWYGQDPVTCSTYGDFFENFGMTANQACCACKK